MGDRACRNNFIGPCSRISLLHTLMKETLPKQMPSVNSLDRMCLWALSSSLEYGGMAPSCACVGVPIECHGLVPFHVPLSTPAASLYL